MRADDVEMAIGKGNALAGEILEAALLRAADLRLASAGLGGHAVLDQRQAGAGGDRSLLQRRELGGLVLVVDHEAAIVAAGGRAAGDAADVLGGLARRLAGEVGGRLDSALGLQGLGTGGMGCKEAEREGGEDREPHGLAPVERAKIGVLQRHSKGREQGRSLCGDGA